MNKKKAIEDSIKHWQRMKAINEIKDELDKNIIKRKGIAVKSYRRKEWYNGYIKGLEMAIYLINKEVIHDNHQRGKR